MTGLEVSSSTLHRVIHRHGFTGKKIQLAKQKSDMYRGEFLAEIWEQFVCSNDDISRFTCLEVASSPGHSQILSRSRGEKSGEGLVPLYVTERKWWTRLVRNVDRFRNDGNVPTQYAANTASD